MFPVSVFYLQWVLQRAGAVAAQDTWCAKVHWNQKKTSQNQSLDLSETCILLKAQVISGLTEECSLNSLQLPRQQGSGASTSETSSRHSCFCSRIVSLQSTVPILSMLCGLLFLLHGCRLFLYRCLSSSTSCWLWTDTNYVIFLLWEPYVPDEQQALSSVTRCVLLIRQNWSVFVFCTTFTGNTAVSIQLEFKSKVSESKKVLLLWININVQNAHTSAQLLSGCCHQKNRILVWPVRGRLSCKSFLLIVFFCCPSGW